MRISKAWTVLVGAVAMAMAGHVRGVTWDDESGDHLWTNAVNWVGNAKPTAGANATFDDTMTGLSTVDTDYTVKYLVHANTVATNELQISPGATLTVAGGYFYAGYSVSEVNLTIKGGGTWQVGTTVATPLWVARGTAGNPVITARVAVAEGTVNLANVSSINVGYQASTGHKPAIGLLDTSGATLVSGIDTNLLRATSLSLGGPQEGRGTLKLNPSVTNITIGTLSMGGNEPYAAGFLDLGTNSELRTLTVDNNLTYAYGQFLCYDNAGNTINGFPGNVAFKMGTASQRAGTLSIADGGHNPGNAESTVYTIGPGLGSFEAYLTDLKVATGSVNGHHRRGSLDLRQSILVALDVMGTIKIGGASSHGKVYLPAGRATCTNLQINVQASNQIAGDGLLSLSNTTLTVAGNVTVGDPYKTNFGIITNQINGVASGIDMTGSLVVTNGGQMNLNFMAPPDNPNVVYWGLRMAGNHTDLLTSLHNAGKLTWGVAGLAPKQQAHCGIQYDEAFDYTFVGLAAAHPGTVIMIR